MIAFGTVSGGVGAKLTGGNFWQGAVTGLFVSGLNHFMHEIVGNSKLTKKYEREIRSLKGKPMSGQESVDVIMGLDTFKTIANNSGNPDVNYVNTASGLSEGGTGTYGDTALYTTTANVQGENYTGSNGGFINVYRDAFSSWRSLGNSIIHELGHAYSRYSGGFAITYGQMGHNWSNTIAVDEIYAYSFARQFGVSFYQPTSTLFVSGLQRALNTLNVK